MSILKQELIPQSKQMQEAQAIVNQTEKDKDKLSIFAIRNEIKSILESAYQEVSINPRRFSSGIVMKLLLSDFLNKDEKRERYLKFYNLFIHNIEQFPHLAEIAIPKFLTMHTLDENARKQCFLNFFEIAYKNAQKNGEEAIIWWRFTLPNLCVGDDLPAEEMRETYFKFLELSIHNARQLITSKNRSAQGWISQWVAKALPKLIKSPILYQEQQQELLALVPEQKYFGSDIYDYRYNFLHSPQKKKENLNTLLANLQQTDQSDPYSNAKEKTDLIFEFTTHAQEHPNFESLKNIKSNILEVLKTYPSPLTADDIIFINNKGVNAFLHSRGLKKLPEDCTQKDLIDILNYKADIPGWEKFKIQKNYICNWKKFKTQKNYICNKEFYHSDSDFEKILKNPEKLQKIFDLLMIGEKDCKDQTRFWTVLVPKILEKINDKKIEEDVNLLKDFINKLDISIDNREKMRIFIAYYFDTKRYQDYPKDSIQQAHLMINAPKPNFGPINEKNFFVSSYAEFHKVQDSKLPQRKADYISYVRRRVRDEDLEMYDYEETDCISSEYRYTEKGVFRRSDHRGPKIRSCSWELLKEDYSYRYNDKIEIGFCPRKDFLHKKEFYLSDEDYWDTKSKEDLPNIPLEFLGKEQRIFEFDEIWKSRIYDLSKPLEQHPRHYTNYVTLLIKQE